MSGAGTSTQAARVIPLVLFGGIQTGQGALHRDVVQWRKTRQAGQPASGDPPPALASGILFEGRFFSTQVAATIGRYGGSCCFSALSRSVGHAPNRCPVRK